MATCAACGQDNPTIARFCLACGAILAKDDERREHRKVVTVLFCDVVGSTALGERLDAEALRSVLARYFAQMRERIESHGGTVEKFIGDAVMAVFGIPAAHEDDALRALRAAAEMRDAVVALNVELERDYGTTLELRIGVNTGEVVAGTEERLATGDAINVANRLEQTAPAGEILLGEATLRLAGKAVEVEPIDPLTLKGKRDPVPAWRLVSVQQQSTARRSDTTLIGRSVELAALASAWDDARTSRTCRLVTVVGPAGVGKSRLVEEFLARSDEPTLRGRCPSYGKGVTYWPVVNVLKQVEARLAHLPLEFDTRDTLVGLLATDGTASTDQIAAAFVAVLDALAAEHPVRLVFDDIQWGEEVFLDLVDRAASETAGPVLLICMARPELLERRPESGSVLRLDPLDTADSERLIEERLRGQKIEADLRERVVSAAGGNPLFVEEMVAMLLESGNGDVTVPPTIQALLAARLDQLDRFERMVLERAAVEGEIFHRTAVQTLVPESLPLSESLNSLVAKDLIRRERSQIVGDEAYRFRHLLIRDAAYASLPKATRAELHERCADWLEESHSELVELDELAGYHLEQTWRYRSELGPANDHVRAVGERAADRLSAAGHRARMRWDARAAIALLERASSLLARDDPKLVRLLPELGSVLLHAQELARAEEVLAEAVDAAAAAGDGRAEARALLESLGLRWRRDPEAMGEELVRGGLRAVRIFEELGDEAGLAQAWLLLSNAYRDQFQMTACREALEAALAHARAAGDASAEALARVNYGLALLSGPARLEEVERYQQENLAWARETGSARVEAAALVLGGRLKAMQGDFTGGRVLIEQGRALFRELGLGWAVVAVANWASEVEELAGDLDAAEREMRDALRACEETGDRRRLAFSFALARLLDLQGRPPESWEPSVYEETVENDDRSIQVARQYWRARILAREGSREEASREVRQALQLAAPPDALLDRCRALMEAAFILGVAGLGEDAAPLAEEALELYERKGSDISAANARRLLAELSA